MKYRLKHIVEYAALRSVTGGVNALPYRATLVLAGLLAAVSWCVLRSRIREGEARMRQVFGERYTPQEIRRMAWQSWRSMFCLAVESIRSASLTEAWFRRTTNAAEFEWFFQMLQARVAAGQGLVLACPHMGAWELGGVMMGLRHLPMLYVAGRQRNPLFDAYLNRVRQRIGMEMVLRGSTAMGQVLRKLQAGRFLAIPPDVRVPRGGVRVRFLGGEANVGDGMARLARLANVPICPVIITRAGWGRHRMRVCPWVEPDPAAERDEDVRRMTQQVMTLIEEAIRAEPGQWFWFNRRWILEPVKH
jgi:Kdo2-lipid IVA lauroyltransferase/acyltransferase